MVIVLIFIALPLWGIFILMGIPYVQDLKRKRRQKVIKTIKIK